MFSGNFKIHLRSARRVQNLCDTNKGFYVKAGQFVAAARQVPREYSSTLSSLQDQVFTCHISLLLTNFCGFLTVLIGFYANSHTDASGSSM